MAVELRCPDCRTKLRLKAAPEAGTEIECPKCATVFPAPEPEADGGDEAPKKKKKAADADEEAAAKEDAVKELKAKEKEGGGEKGKKTKAKKEAKGKDENPNAPKKRKAKKKQTSKAALIAVISTGVIMLLSMSGVLIWFFTRTSKAVEMFYYAPEDAQMAMGINLGHAQKYSEFYKSLKTLQTGTDFKTAGDTIAKAAGGESLDDLADYVAKASSVKNGWSIVYRTKAEFDGDALGKIPGAVKKTLDGKTYYTVIRLLPNNGTGLVFAPTNRLIVVCPASMENMPEFKRILAGHPDSKDRTLGVRMGALGKRVTRGTFWVLTLYDDAVKPDAAPAESGSGGNTGGTGGTPPAPGGGAPGAPAGGAPGGGGGGNSADNEEKIKKARQFADGLSGAKGFGVKASLGSREVRFEIVVWHREGEKASSFAKKMKESELGKGDEGNPPKWFKEDTTAMGDRKVAAQLLSNISFGSSGELFYVRSSVETVDLQQAASTAMGKVLGIAPKQGGMDPGGGMGPPGGAPGGAPPGGVPPGGAPPGGVPPGMPPKMRRRHRPLSRARR